MNGFSWDFLLYELNVGVSKIIPKLILRKIIDLYPLIKFVNIGMSIFRNLVCGATQNILFGSGLTNSIEFH